MTVIVKLVFPIDLSFWFLLISLDTIDSIPRGI